MSDVPAYRDANLAIDRRTDDLLARMTLVEKVGQMCQVDGRRDPITWVRDHHVGSVLHLMGEALAEVQQEAEQTRLGIPLLCAIDAIHGHALYPGATVFPTQLAMSSSWNPKLLEQVGRITATEASATGIHWTFSPVLCIARDLRWGRIGETFGEDPYLIGELACAMIRGYQGADLSDPTSILACAKHYAGYSQTQGGRDASEAELSRRNMLTVFLPAFEAAARAACATFMTAYQAIDGTPCTANPWLLRETLKEQWGFEGFVVTDWNNIGWLHTLQKVCPTMADAVCLAVESGNDMAMSTPEFCELAIAAVKDGRLKEQYIDESCRRILRLKFRLGLFDSARAFDPSAVKQTLRCAAHRDAALEAAYESIVLLKNDGLLPLKPDVKRIAVLGPNADDVIAQLGDWAALVDHDGVYRHLHPRENIVTVLDGVRQRAGASVAVDCCKGCDVIEPDTQQIRQAAELAGKADVAVVVVGDTKQLTGEGHDRTDLSLSGGQQELLEAVHASGTPTVVVLINTKPLTIRWAVEHAAAIVEAWNPGSEGGKAVAGTLFGDRNPSGKLTISFPRHVGQQPVYYNHIPGWHGGSYVDLPDGPLFAFGFGLSYTTYEYANLRIDQTELRIDEVLRATVDVTNTGRRSGVETVQLYVNDVYSSVTTPGKELKAFQRVTLEPGETKTVAFELPCARLSLINRKLQRVVEPGEFELMVGSSSRDEDLLRASFRILP